MTDYPHFSLEDTHNKIHCSRILLEQSVTQPIGHAHVVNFPDKVQFKKNNE